MLKIHKILQIRQIHSVFYVGVGGEVGDDISGFCVGNVVRVVSVRNVSYALTPYDGTLAGSLHRQPLPTAEYS
ncbi:MAG: hypothetical protein LCI00_33190 [Chloroflexi bacterium]|nr:hypothetical protein [Chloroflexota bacterium]MCC6896534.1 hypothetical protein [Anaerolineae bacterium]